MNYPRDLNNKIQNHFKTFIPRITTYVYILEILILDYHYIYQARINRLHNTIIRPPNICVRKLPLKIVVSFNILNVEQKLTGQDA